MTNRYTYKYFFIIDTNTNTHVSTILILFALIDTVSAILPSSDTSDVKYSQI